MDAFWTQGAASRARASGTVGLKAWVAASGLSLWIWTCLHLFGTLTVFAGAERMERYAAWLRQGASVPLWCLRSGLLSAFVLHVWLVLRLWARARRARPVAYAHTGNTAALALRWGAAALLVLIVAHVLHFSFGAGLPRFTPEHVHANLLGAFTGAPWMALLYVLFAALFGLHLVHGRRAAAVSLGSPLSQATARGLGTLLGVSIGVGFALIPIAIWLGVVS